MLKVIPAKESEITRLVCPHCKERVPRVGIKKDSRCEGITFRCRRCGMLWEVEATSSAESNTLPGEGTK